MAFAEEVSYWAKIFDGDEWDTDRLKEHRDRLRQRIVGVDGLGRLDAYNPMYRVFGAEYRAVRTVLTNR